MRTEKRLKRKGSDKSLLWRMAYTYFGIYVLIEYITDTQIMALCYSVD